MKKSRARSEESPTYTGGSRATAPTNTGPVLRSGDDVAAQCEDFRSADREHFYSFHLDVRHRVIGRELISLGTVCGVEVHPREVFRRALLANAVAVIFVHNHPSGDPAPSRQDLELTTRLRQVGELLGVKVLDHVVVSETGHASFADRGWL